jgi:hypothetical protein
MDVPLLPGSRPRRLATISYQLLTLLTAVSRLSARNLHQSEPKSASLSLNKAPIWDLRPDLYYSQTVAGLLMWGSVSDERTVLSFTTAADPRQRSHSRVRVPWNSRPYFTVSDSRLLFVASYDSQGYCGGIRPRLHMIRQLVLFLYCGVFTPCKNCNIETHSRDYATVNEAVFSPCRAEP